MALQYIAMSEIERFIPDPANEKAKIQLIEEALSSDLLDHHYRFVERGLSPTADIDDADYGYIPEPWDASVLNDPRPTREPLDWRSIAVATLNKGIENPNSRIIERDSEFSQIALMIRDVYDGWLPFLQSKYDLSDETVSSLEIVRARNYFVGNLTEDNLPSYVRDIFYAIMAGGAELGGALDEELRMWTAEENGHKHAMDMFGEITDLSGSIKYVRGLVSQHRAGSSVEVSHITGVKVYASGQEGQTVIAHRRSAALFDPIGFDLHMEESADEARHQYLFVYEVLPVLHAFPDDTIRTIADNDKHGNHMPGVDGIPRILGIKGHAVAISLAGLLTKQDWHNTTRQNLQKWGLMDQVNDFEKNLTSDESKIELEELRTKYEKPAEFVPNHRIPFVLGSTITSDQLRVARKEYLALKQDQLAA